MLSKKSLRPYVIRLLVIVVFSTIFVFIFNEAAYFALKDENDRAPQTFELVIPAGTAAKIAAGEPVPSIPDEMVFVLGDTLEVKNEDVQPHQLGPIWVPPGTTGKLVMKQADRLAYQCSFSTSRYLGLDVRQGTTLGVRLVALGIAMPTMAVLVFLYSLVMFPIKPAGAVAG